jgi:hypothetical protein
MGWMRRSANVPGPYAASGEQNSGQPVTVELLIDGDWTDITSSVRVGSSGNIAMAYGQTDENANMQPSSCTLMLNNRNAQYSPRNPLSLLYGKIGRNTPLRVSVPDGNVSNVRFWGEVPSWPQNWDTTGNDIWVELQAASVLRRLGQNNQVLRSTMYQGYTSAALVNPPVAYWPLEDGSGATQMASAISGGTAMAIVGAPTLSTYTGFDCSDPLPTLTAGASFSGSVGTYTYTGYSQTRVLLAFPGAGSLVDKSTLVQMKGTGTAHTFELYYNTGGAIGLRAFDHGGTSVGDTGAISFAVDGRQMRFSIELTQSGTTIKYFLSRYVPQAAAGDYNSGTLATGQTMGSIQQVNLAPSANANGLSVGHVTVQTVFSDIFDLLSNINAYSGETADARAFRLITQAGVAAGGVGVGGDSVAMGTQHSGALLTLLQDCVDADGGSLYDRWLGLGIGYRERTAVYNANVALVLDYAAFNLAAVPRPVDDDRYTKNDITISRTNGSSARQFLPTGTLSVLPPPLGVGQYLGDKTINVQSDATLADQAGWRLHVGTLDQARYPVITVNLAHSSFASNAALRSQVINTRPGSRIQVLNPPTQTQADPLDLLVVGGSETLTRFEHVITFTCVPFQPYQVAKLADPVLSVADTAGSTLAFAASATQTGLYLLTSGIPDTLTNPLWTAKVTDYPFDLELAGERITASCPGNMINGNPLFATGLTGWNAAASTVSLDNTFQYAPDYASALVVPDGVSASGGLNSDHSAVGTVTAANTYTVNCWVWCPAGWSDVRTAADWYDASNAFLSSSLGSATVVSSNTWTLLSQDVTAPASASRAVLRFRWGSTPPSSVTFWITNATMVDDSTVNSTTTPQLVTVVRSVNGIVKAQPAGGDVRLFTPMILAL